MPRSDYTLLDLMADNPYHLPIANNGRSSASTCTTSNKTSTDFVRQRTAAKDKVALSGIWGVGAPGAWLPTFLRFEATDIPASGSGVIAVLYVLNAISSWYCIYVADRPNAFVVKILDAVWNFVYFACLPVHMARTSLMPKTCSACPKRM